MKKYKIIDYFIEINNPIDVIIKEKTINAGNIRLALNTHKCYADMTKNYVCISTIVYLLNDNDEIIISEDLYSPMSHDRGIAINYAIINDELAVGIPPRLEIEN